MTMTVVRTLSAASLLVGSSMLAGAEEAPVEASDQVLREVVVTATKRSENLQEVPISITAIDQSTIESLGSPRLRDLEFSVPNLIVSGADTSTKSTIGLRGISTDDRNIGFETGVGVYVDGVFQGRSTSFNQNLSDIDTVEVLRGPQGTLFGKNTIAGAININTIKPSATPAARLVARTGNLGLREGSAYLTGPLVEGRLLGKLSAFGTSRDGYYTNEFTGKDEANKHEHGGRLQLTFLPSDALTMQFSLDGAKDHSRYIETEVTGPSEDTPGFVPGPRTVDEQQGLATRTIWGTSLTANYAMSSGYQLTSISAWRDARTVLAQDLDRTSAPILGFVSHDDNHDFSQELRIASPKSDRLNFVAGLYYLDQTAQTDRPVTFDSDVFGIDDQYDNAGHVRTHSFAAFGSASYQFTDPLTATVGLRYNREKKTLVFRQDGTVIVGLPDLDLQDERSDNDVSPTAVLSYKLDARTLMYAKVARGFKSGGWNADFTSGSDDNADGVVDIAETNIRFRPEKLTSYEVGFKATLLDNRLRFNTALYWADYTDLQVSQFNSSCSCRSISNAGQARSRGLEVEVAAVPLPGLTLSGGLGYSDARYTDFVDGDGPGTNLKGERLANAPRWTASVSALYEQRLGERAGSAFIGTDLSYRSAYYADPGNDPLGLISSFTLLNARLGWRAANDRYEIFAWGRNLADKLYAIDRYREQIVFDQQITVYAMPRTYGLQLTAKF